MVDVFEVGKNTLDDEFLEFMIVLTTAKVHYNYSIEF